MPECTKPDPRGTTCPAGDSARLRRVCYQGRLRSVLDDADNTDCLMVAVVSLCVCCVGAVLQQQQKQQRRKKVALDLHS